MTYDTGMRRFYPLRPVVSIPPAGPRQLQEAQDAGQHVKRQGDVGLAFLFEMRGHHSPLLLLPKEDKTSHSDLLEIQDLKSTLLLNAE